MLYRNGHMMFLVFLLIGILFSLYGGLFSIVGYHKLFQFCLYYFPRSFSVGEAFLVSQAASLFLYASSINILNAIQNVPIKISHISTSIIQVKYCIVLSVCFEIFFSFLDRFNRYRYNMFRIIQLSKFTKTV